MEHAVYDGVAVIMNNDPFQLAVNCHLILLLSSGVQYSFFSFIVHLFLEMAVNLSKNSAALTAAWKDVLNDKSQTDW